jgi:hypothetical protein
MAAPGTDPTEFLHVNVDEFTGAAAFVTADRFPRGPIQVRETVEVVADQDPIHRRGGQLEAGGDAVGADLVALAVSDDAGFYPGGQAGGRVAGAARTITQAVGTELDVAMPPLRDALPGDPHPRGHMGDRGAGLDPLAEQQSTPLGCRGVTVTHEDLRRAVLASTPAHLQPEVFVLVDPYRVTNVCERNN